MKKPDEIKNDEYYYQLAIDYFGMDIRDNTRDQKIAIGKAVDNGTLDTELM